MKLSNILIVGLTAAICFLLYCSKKEQDVFSLPYLKDDLTASGPCPYEGESFYYAYWQTPDSVGGVDVGYRFSDCVTNCEYDSEEIREKLIKMMNNKIYRKSEFVNSRDYWKDGICLKAWYEFPNSPDFVLLKYYHFIETRTFYLGYLKSTQELFFLDDIRNESMKENYNRMIDSHSDILDLDTQCRAALMVALTQGDGNIVILDSFPDIYPAVTAYQTYYYDLPVPPTPGYFNDLYIFHIYQHDSILQRSDHIYRYNKNHFDELILALQDSLDVKALSITPPNVIETEEGAVVELTSYDSEYGIMAWWRIEFDNEDFLIDCRPIDSVKVLPTPVYFNL